MLKLMMPSDDDQNGRQDDVMQFVEVLINIIYELNNNVIYERNSD